MQPLDVHRIFKYLAEEHQNGLDTENLGLLETLTIK